MRAHVRGRAPSEYQLVCGEGDSGGQHGRSTTCGEERKEGTQPGDGRGLILRDGLGPRGDEGREEEAPMLTDARVFAGTA